MTPNRFLSQGLRVVGILLKESVLYVVISPVLLLGESDKFLVDFSAITPKLIHDGKPLYFSVKSTKDLLKQLEKILGDDKVKIIKSEFKNAVQYQLISELFNKVNKG
jgi:hypothetical protein